MRNISTNDKIFIREIPLKEFDCSKYYLFNGRVDSKGDIFLSVCLKGEYRPDIDPTPLFLTYNGSLNHMSFKYFIKNLKYKADLIKIKNIFTLKGLRDRLFKSKIDPNKLEDIFNWFWLPEEAIDIKQHVIIPNRVTYVEGIKLLMVCYRNFPFRPEFIKYMKKKYGLTGKIGYRSLVLSNGRMLETYLENKFKISIL